MRCVLFILALSAALVAGCKSKANVKADLSSPRAAARSFARALEAGDAPSARACVILAGDKDGQLIDAIAGVFAAGRKLGDVAVVKFGDPGRQLSSEGREQFSILRKVEDAEEDIKGDTATLSAKHDSDQSRGAHPDALVLKKAGGDWKIDGASIIDPDGYSKAMAFCAMLTRTTQELTDEVSAGKYRTVQQVKDERARRIAAALFSGAATQPQK